MTPTARRSRRSLVAGAALALIASTALTGMSPAAAATTQTGSCVDGAGVRWNAKAAWGPTYTLGHGARKVVLDDAGWTTTQAGTVPTDALVQTYDGTGTRLQSLSWTGEFDYGAGTEFLTRDPLNPPSAPGQARVTITMGVDGDGRGGCTTTFRQPGTAPSASDTYEAEVVSATNRERTTRSLAALTAQSCVDAYAESQSAAMAADRRMYHQDLGPILAQCHLMAVGENVAYGYPDARSVTAAWMASPGHRSNILNPRYRLIGVGASQSSDGTWYTSQVFGSTS